jgi:formate hydrogenlyase transcriptional activator
MPKLRNIQIRQIRSFRKWQIVNRLFNGMRVEIYIVEESIFLNNCHMVNMQTNSLSAISDELALVETREDLSPIFRKLKMQLGFSHSTLFVVTGDARCISDFLADHQPGSPFFREIKLSKTPLEPDDEILQNMFAYLQPGAACNFRNGIVLNLNQGSEIIGSWVILYESTATSLLRMLVGIANQLSTAVQNIIANQKVRHQLEISGYKSRLGEEKISLHEEIDAKHDYADIIGKSPELQKVFRLVAQVAPSDSTVMILGETGTGKELIARAIHNNSRRRGKLMVMVNCAALQPNLIESELFGHERGSFTGATERRVGKFELAHNGSLFLDEIGEMPLDLQVKLLRALQEKEIERIGGRTTIKVDVRIIAATNRDLELEVKEGRFRIDLYFRLNIFPVHLPPLRHRVEDIPLLASHFISRFSKKTGSKINSISNRALQELKQYSWPGNIRELEHLIERSILLTSGETLTHIALPPATSVSTLKNNMDEYSLKTIDDNERDHILRTLKFCRGKVDGKGGAAEILGVPASTLHSKMKKLGIGREHFKLRV